MAAAAPAAMAPAVAAAEAAPAVGAAVAAAIQPAMAPAGAHAPGRARHQAYTFRRRVTGAPLICAAMTHLTLMFAGLVLLMQATQVGLTLGVHGNLQGSLWVGLRDASIMVVRNLLGPFIEEGTLAQALAREGLGGKAFDIDVLGIWAPALFSVLFMGTSLLGFSALRYGRPSSVAAYALFSAVVLVWMAEAGRVMKEVSSWEDLNQSRAHRSHGGMEASEMEHLQRFVFRTSFTSFSQLYSEHQCSLVSDQTSLGSREGSSSIRCASTAVEATIVELLVQNICRPELPSQSGAFAERASECQKHGRALNLLPETPTETDGVYCRCWCATFRWLQFASYWFMLVWFGLLSGVLAVIYLVAEPKLSRMGPIERAEVLTFASIVMLILACRVTFFFRGLPMVPQ